MADNQNPNPHQIGLPISDDEEPEHDSLFDDDWLQDPLDPFYGALGGPKLDFAPYPGSSSTFNPMNVDPYQVQAGTVGTGGPVDTVDSILGGMMGGGGINWREKEKEREKVEEMEREEWKKKMSHTRTLLLERRRTRRFNENLLKLRAEVPNISNMDRMSTLCDTIDYVKELTQRVQDLQNELDQGSGSFSNDVPPVPYQIPQFEYLGSRSAFVDVKINDKGEIYIHMFCKPNPALIPATLRALDLLKLDVRQSNIGSLTSFVLDVFCNKQPDNKPAWKAEDIKSLLLACIAEGNETNN